MTLRLTASKVGADFILICTNTMHKVAPQVADVIEIPLVHLADATGKRTVASGFKSVGFLGTKFSMEDYFYTGRLRDKYDLAVQIPSAEDRELVHYIIYDELCLGSVSDKSRREFLMIMSELYARGVECDLPPKSEPVELGNFRF